MIPALAMMAAGASPVRWGQCFDNGETRIKIEHDIDGCAVVELQGSGHVDAKMIRNLIALSRVPNGPS